MREATRLSGFFRAGAPGIVLFLAGMLASARSAPPMPAPGAGFSNFVGRSGDRLTDGASDFRFIGTNMPDVLQIISETDFAQDFETHRYRLPDEFEIRDAVATERQLGGKVMRAFVITCRDHPDPNFMFDVSSLPVKANEKALRVIDRLLQVCNEQGVRVYLPFVAAGSAIRGDTRTYGADFWTIGSPANLRFKDMIAQLLNRTNTCTGVRYKDDPAVFAWESGNELIIAKDPARRRWLHDIAAYVKGIDRNHLFMDGRNDPKDVYGLYGEFLDDANIDLLSYHTYHSLPGLESPVDSLRAMRAYLHGRKPLVVGEIAMTTPPPMLRRLLAEIAADGTVGANFWGQRFHNRDGGFYRHSDTGSQFEDLNWPGFPASDGPLAEELRTERMLQDILSEAAYRLAGKDRPPLPVPAAPVLLPIRDAGHLSWRGSTGATRYAVERAPAPGGPWALLARNVEDNRVIGNAPFADEAARAGESWWYRVTAANDSGESPVSNAVGPVSVDASWLIDEFFDLSRLDSHSRNVRIETHRARDAYQEDRSLLVQEAGDGPAVVVYGLPGDIDSVAVCAYYFESDPLFSVSSDGIHFQPAQASRQQFDGGRRARYEVRRVLSGFRFIRIAFDASASKRAALGRVEIRYAARQQPRSGK